MYLCVCVCSFKSVNLKLNQSQLFANFAKFLSACVDVILVCMYTGPCVCFQQLYLLAKNTLMAFIFAVAQINIKINLNLFNVAREKFHKGDSL